MHCKKVSTQNERFLRPSHVHALTCANSTPSNCADDHHHYGANHAVPGGAALPGQHRLPLGPVQQERHGRRHRGQLETGLGHQQRTARLWKGNLFGGLSGARYSSLRKAYLNWRCSVHVWRDLDEAWCCQWAGQWPLHAQPAQLHRGLLLVHLWEHGLRGGHRWADWRAEEEIRHEHWWRLQSQEWQGVARLCSVPSGIIVRLHLEFDTFLPRAWIWWLSYQQEIRSGSSGWPVSFTTTPGST